MAKKIIKWETTVYGKKVHKLAITFPVYYVDEYGYTCYSKDGNTTIEIGLNGVQCNVENTHSISVRKYFSGEGYAKRKKDITPAEWREALTKVQSQVKAFINDTL